MPLWRDLIESRFGDLRESSAEKVLPLPEAIRRFVEPGMKLNACYLQGRPNAAIYALARQFAGRDPGFEFYSSSLVSNFALLAHLRLLRRAVVSFVGEGIPTPGPSPVVQRALARGELELENYTMLTIPLRLLAGAMGASFLPTRSLAGSSLGEEARKAGTFVEIADPFEPGRRAGLLRAYQPDVAIAHVWAADRAGNAVVFPPFAEGVYGILAARRGAILTAERIVSTDFIRRHANLVRIPAEVVRAVCPAPYGSHPIGLYARGIPEFRSYANDYDFIGEHRDAGRDEETYDRWVREWVLDVGDHAGYVAKLGSQRLQKIHVAAEPESWRAELEEAAERLDPPLPASPVEGMIVHAARHLAGRIRSQGYQTVLAGVGQATLMTWLAAHLLREEGVEFAMMLETGVLGHDPRPADPFGFNYRNLPTARMLTDIFEILQLYGGGAHNRCIGTIGAGQIDRFGNINSTRAADGSFLVGSGGANDIASTAREVAVVAVQRRGTFVDRVDYVTSPGARVRSVVTPLGRFEKRGGEELVLTGYAEAAGADRDSIVREIRERCGWELDVAADLAPLAPPTAEELALLRIYDPERIFLGRTRRPE
jgi:acyl CoA:acetate/3-ketoacid CoA transferase alpha subunit/acyl CoA:acetate/3-ketoacid CoA transferase beta subunit